MNWLLRTLFGWIRTDALNVGRGGVGVGRDIRDSTIQIQHGLDVQETAQEIEQRIDPLREELFRSTKLQYFVVERLGVIINAVAHENGWGISKELHSESGSFYYFEKLHSGTEGLLFVSEGEFKNLWLLEESARLRHISERLFGDPNRVGTEVSVDDDKYLVEVVRQAAFKTAEGPLGISVAYQPDGNYIFHFSRTRDEAERPLCQISSQRRTELRAMIPLLRYATIANQTESALRALLKCAERQAAERQRSLKRQQVAGAFVGEITMILATLSGEPMRGRIESALAQLRAAKGVTMTMDIMFRRPGKQLDAFYRANTVEIGQFQAPLPELLTRFYGLYAVFEDIGWQLNREVETGFKNTNRMILEETVQNEIDILDQLRQLGPTLITQLDSVRNSPVP